jgi:membrane fusion protein, multidrug efflux system
MMSTLFGRAAARPRTTTSVLALLAAGGLLAAHEAGPSHAASPQPVPVVSVAVKTLTEQEIRGWSEFSGRLQAVDAAEIRPEVGGRITEILFHDGQSVAAGDLLLVIDPRSYEAAAARAEANLASARTNAGFAKVEFERAAALLPSQTIAQRVYDERANASRVAEAAVKAADAELAQARLDLEHAHVKAPISGRVSRAEITVGNLVQPGPAAPLLTTIVSDKSIYADFEVDEQTYVGAVRHQGERRIDERKIPVELSLQGDEDHVYRGTIDSFDNRIDPATGTIRARARFENADGALVPGMFVSVKLADAASGHQILVPDRAVGFDQSKKFVYVVGADNKVAYRQVELGKEIQSERVALSGVRSGDRVIVDGIQHVHPELVVDAKEAEAPVITGTN